jgi:hypothetical protein
MARFTPQDFTPGYILNVAFNGYSYLLLAKRAASITIVGVYHTAKLAEAARARTVVRYNKIIPTKEEFPVVEVISTRDAWRMIALGRDPQWLEWLVDGFLSTINTYGVEGPLSRTFALKLAREHRTIQQSTLRTLQMTLVQYLALDPGTDLRNHAAVEWAREVVAIPAAMPMI